MINYMLAGQDISVLGYDEPATDIPDRQVKGVGSGFINPLLAGREYQMFLGSGLLSLMVRMAG